MPKAAPRELQARRHRRSKSRIPKTKSQTPRNPKRQIGIWDLGFGPGDFSVQRRAQQLFHQLAARAVRRHEPLHALTRKHLAGVDVSHRIVGDHVQAEELPAVLDHASELTDHLARFALESTEIMCGPKTAPPFSPMLPS